MTSLTRERQHPRLSKADTGDLLQPVPRSPVDNFVTLPDVPTDAMNVLLSYLNFQCYVSLTKVSLAMREAVFKASHLFTEDLSDTSTAGRSCYAIDQEGGRHSSAASSSHKVFRVKWNGSSVRKLLSQYDSLRVLQLDNLAPIGDDLFKLLNQSPTATKLRSLVLKGVSLSYWCTDGLELKHLQHLTVTGGSIRSSLRNLCIGSPNLTSLSIGRTSSLGDGQITDLVDSIGWRLDQLSLHQCTGLRRPRLVLAKVARLSLVAAYALRALPGFDCPNLKALDLSFCFQLKTEELHRIMDQTPLLEELILIKCHSLNALELYSWKNKSLRIINVSLCLQLNELRIRSPRLSRLDTSGCSSLQTLVMDLGSAPLVALHLSFLPKLMWLEVSSTKLCTLRIIHCRSLDHVSVHCPALQSVDLRGSRRVALRFCKSVYRVMLKDWTQRRCLDVPVSLTVDASKRPNHH